MVLPRAFPVFLEACSLHPQPQKMHPEMKSIGANKSD